MDAILLKPKNNKELKLLTELLSKMKVSSKVITEEYLEDFALGSLMKEADRTKTVSREAIFKKLKS